jgi:hypothetical protein
MKDWEQKVRERAHALWEQGGRLEGWEREHWERTCREVDHEAQHDGTGRAHSAHPQSAGGLSAGFQPGGTLPGGSPAAGAGSIGTGGGSTGNRVTGAAAQSRH